MTPLEPLARAGSQVVQRAFERYRALFHRVTRRARRRFEHADWAGMRHDAQERLGLYRRVVDQTERDLQQVLTRAKEFDVIATMNLNGDYLSDALAAQVGGIGIAPGGNINYITGHAIFEATHGTAPKYANLDKVNPGSLSLSGEMMLRYLGWNEAADCVIRGIGRAIGDKIVTYDFARLMEGATEVKCSEFADAVIERM